jgi:hypothetical protein
MLGYEYKDVQKFGETLTKAIVLASLAGDKETREGLTKIWDFFEGLIGEGYINES